MLVNTGGTLSRVGEQVKFEQKNDTPPPLYHMAFDHVPCLGRREFGWGREIELRLHCTFGMGEFGLFSFFSV